MMQKLTAHVSGKVQMAGYRSKVVTIARAFGLKGYVRNLPDGRVKILAEGPFDDLDRFLKAIRIENTLIKVDDVKSEFSDALGAYDDFFKVAGENETDARLDVAADHLKELIVVVKDGFNSRDCEGRSGKSPSLRVGMKEEPFARITFAPRRLNIYLIAAHSAVKM